ncbi:hypothetical protein CsSME_00025441 [Camellia sinensis var. sinensis]
MGVLLVKTMKRILIAKLKTDFRTSTQSSPEIRSSTEHSRPGLRSDQHKTAQISSDQQQNCKTQNNLCRSSFQQQNQNHTLELQQVSS